MKNNILYLVAMFSLIIFAEFAFDHSRAQQKTIDLPVNKAQAVDNPRLSDKTFSRLISAAETTGAARVIVGIGSDFVPEGRLNENKIQTQRFSIKQ